MSDSESSRQKWAQYPALTEFEKYFIKEWCYHDGQWSRFWRWQLFQTPAGVASTNNCLESFNKQIKNVYTNYQTVSLYQFLLIVIEKLINLHSYRPKPYCFYREPDYDMILKANEIVDLNIQFVMTEPNRFWYDQRYS